MRKINLNKVRVGAGVRPTSKAGAKPGSAKVAFRSVVTSGQSVKSASNSKAKSRPAQKGEN